MRVAKFLVPCKIGNKSGYCSGDVFNIQKRLKDYDENLDIGWNEREQAWEIQYFYRSNTGKSGWKLVKRIRGEEGLNPSIVDEILMSDLNKTNALRKFDEEFAAKEKENDKKLQERLEKSKEELYKRLVDSGFKTDVYSMRRSRAQRRLSKLNTNE